MRIVRECTQAVQFILALITVCLCCESVKAAVTGGCSIQITSAYTCDSNAKAYSPEVGDPYYVLVNFTVTGTPLAPYSIQFTEANETGTVTKVPASPGTYSYYYGFQMPLDSTIPVTIVIDPSNVSGAPAAGRTSTFSFTPVPPSTAIQYFDTQTWQGEEDLVVDWKNPNALLGGETWLGEPTSDSYQQLLAQTVPANSQITATNPTADPILLTTFAQSASSQSWLPANKYALALSSVRVNPILLRQSTWSSLSSLPASFLPWLTPDDEVQSADPHITAFVASVLPSNYLTTLTPYDAARDLFLAIVARTTYVSAPDNDGTALGTLETGQANTQGFSYLFDACLQSIGIPVRSISGFFNGENQWHNANEFYLPGGGWIPADGAIAKAWDPTGTYSYDFGSMPQINSFCACSRSTQEFLPVYSVDGDQFGVYFYSYTGSTAPTVTGFSTTSYLNAVTLAPSYSLYASPPMIDVTVGNHASDVVTVNPANGFADPVVFSASGLPTGIVPTITTSSNGMSASIALTAASTVVPGSYTFKVSGTTGTLTATVPISLNVLAQTAGPKITSFTPTTAPIGSTITITGSGLSGATAVTFTGGVSVTPTTVSASTVTATVPYGVASGPISVTTPGGSAISSKSFTALPTPVISTFTPSAVLAGAGATKISFTGENLAGVTSVIWNGHALTSITSTSTTATAVIAAAYLKTAASASIAITAAGGTATTSVPFVVYGKPTITAISPTSGPVGTTLTITGTNLNDTSKVTFAGGVTAVPASASTVTSVTVTVPAGAKTGGIAVTVPAGTVASTQVFTVLQVPMITQLSPAYVKVGSGATRVTLSGSNLAVITSVTWNGHALTSVTVSGTTSLSGIIAATYLTAPASAPIIVTNAAGSGQIGPFVVYGVPTVTSFTPSSVLVGAPATALTITGTNLSVAASVTWNGHALTGLSSTSTTNLVGTIPASALTAAAVAPIVITTPGGSVTSSAKFMVIGKPTITNFTPTTGKAGTVVTISGTNLTGASLVTFGGGATAVPTSITSTSVKVTVPTKAADGPLTITTPGGTATSKSSFTV